MPNGGYDGRSLSQQVADVVRELKETNKALDIALDMLGKMIQENKQIRKLAKLPDGDYPKEISVGNHIYKRFE